MKITATQTELSNGKFLIEATFEGKEIVIRKNSAKSFNYIHAVHVITIDNDPVYRYTLSSTAKSIGSRVGAGSPTICAVARITNK